jgi:hypothetical protein
MEVSSQIHARVPGLVIVPVQDRNPIPRCPSRQYMFINNYFYGVNKLVA